MALEMGLWRVDGDKPIKLSFSPMQLESRLESHIQTDPMLLGIELLLIGRQVPTAHGKYVDLLGIDSEGTVHILELKRDKTPREVVAQLLDYGSWVKDLGNADIRDIFESKHAGEIFDTAFANQFGAAPPDELNGRHQLTIVASGLDASTERIVAYLATEYGVPINAVFFRYFEDQGRDYLARTWLIDEVVQVSPTTAKRKSATEATWDKLSWYVSFGEEADGRSWEDARKYGFVSAGGGSWYSKTLANLPVGARIYTFTPGKPHGYVGVGTVSGPAAPLEEALLSVDGATVPFVSLNLQGSYVHAKNDEDPDDDVREWVAPVEWERTVPRRDGVWEKGFFANQNSATRLRSTFTIEAVNRAFGLDD